MTLTLVLEDRCISPLSDLISTTAVRSGLLGQLEIFFKLKAFKEGLPNTFQQNHQTPPPPPLCTCVTLFAVSFTWITM